MRILAALVLAAALGACAPSGPPEGFGPKTTDAYAAAEGAKFRMASIVGIGDIAISESALTTSDGQVIPIEKVSDGVYFFPNPPSELTNGENFCFSKPVTFFTWHKHNDGVWVMNVGDWRSPPRLPGPDEWSADNGCGGFTYEPASAA